MVPHSKTWKIVKLKIYVEKNKEFNFCHVKFKILRHSSGDVMQAGGCKSGLPGSSWLETLISESSAWWQDWQKTILNNVFLGALQF